MSVCNHKLSRTVKKQHMSDSELHLSRGLGVFLFVAYVTLTDPLEIQLWSQDKRAKPNQTENTVIGENRGKKTKRKRIR